MRTLTDLDSLASRLRATYAGPAIPPIRLDAPDLTIRDAYAIQALNTRHWIASGRRVVGAKIGLTSRAVQAQLGVDQPDFGMLFDDARVHEGGNVATGRLLQPRVEGEIALCLARDIADIDRGRVADGVAYALPALEIVDSRIDGWNITMVDTVADNASAGLFVLGTEPVDISGLDLAACTMRLRRNGEIASQGSGAACLDNPLNALAWLVEAHLHHDLSLKAGDIVLSGAMGPMVPASPGDAFEAEIDGIGRVSVHFED